MELQNVLYEVKNKIAYVTINRPKVLNALNRQTVDELRDVFLDVRHKSDALAVILTGSGEKSFVAGADINELAALSMERIEVFTAAHDLVFRLLSRGKVDGDPARREVELRVLQCGAHAVAAFLDLGLREADEVERGQSPRKMHLDRDRWRVKAG